MKNQGAKILEKKETQGDGIAFGSLELPEEVDEKLRSSTEGDKFMKLRRKTWSQRLPKRGIQVPL